ncbi:ABC transporter permease [Amycolatopsis sp. WAC 04197]|uniref:ABC transporter permease n=1 Tax=Amycolatopsis sp. WAC 04197 TaxID=2203199 RepID=UPI0018F532DA|nr:ABC transporter permease [Amycolatopsis sp. WAC 04197]
MISTMWWLAGRFAWVVVVVVGAVTLCFFGLHAGEGDPVTTLVGGNPVSPQTLETIRKDLGLDRPLVLQYLAQLGALASGDLGRSYQLQQPVAEVIGSQLGSTVELALAAGTLAIAGAIVVAVFTAGRNKALRATSNGLELLAASTPPFWLAVLLLTFFSFGLKLFPVSGADGPYALVLPVLSMAIPLGAVLAQVLRDSVERALSEPFVLTVRARGASETWLRTRHVLRHALLPLVTLSGWLFGSLFGGSVVVESVFARPGLGQVILRAVINKDTPVVTAVVVLSAVVFVVLNMIVDLLYRVIDPRLRRR